MQLPFISVILPVRNEEKFIAACVDSIFLQDYPAELMEVIFVDGRSEDRTVAMLREMQQGLCIKLEGWDVEGNGREFQKGRDVCMPMADSC